MSRADFEMDEQLKEIALRVADEVWPSHSIGGLFIFASRFLAALPKPEPVGVCDTENRIRWGGNDSSHRYSSAPNWLRVGTHIYTEAPLIQPAQGNSAELARADLEATVKEQAAEIAELQRWRTSGIERSAKDSDLVSLYRQQLAAAQLHIEQLRGAMLMMLCDSEGKCCMAGSVKDRFIIDTALSTQPDRSALEADRQRVAEACAKVCENDESGRDSGGYFADTIRAGQWREHL